MKSKIFNDRASTKKRNQGIIQKSIKLIGLYKMFNFDII
jgi:hypothetical protein